MNNYYSHKYKKYLNKNMFGGVLSHSDIIRYTNSITEDLGSNWCYTGSVAIYFYCLFCNIPHPPMPNDLDIIYVPDNCLTKPMRIAGFNRDPINDTDHGLPYYDSMREKMIDLICSKSMSYCDVSFDGINIKLIEPKKLLDSYEDRLEDILSSQNDEKAIIKNKIALIHQIVLLTHNLTVQTYNKSRPESELEDNNNTDNANRVLDLDW